MKRQLGAGSGGPERGAGRKCSAAFVAGFAALALLFEAPDADGFAEEEHEDDGGHEDAGVEGRLHNAERNEEGGGEGGGLTGADEQGCEYGEGDGKDGGPDAGKGHTGSGDGADVPGVRRPQGEVSGADSCEMAGEDAIGTGAAAVRGLDKLVGGGAEAGKDEGLVAGPTGKGRDEDEEGFAERGDEEVAFLHRMNGMRAARGRRRIVRAGVAC